MNEAQENAEIRARGNCPPSVGETLLCPECGERMKKWATPNDPFSDWDTDFLYICFNDACPYFVRGYETMNKQGNRGISYRLTYDPGRNSCMPIPVSSPDALRGWIVE